MASMPSGREIHSPKPFVVPTLDEDVLSRMRAPPSPNEALYRGDVTDSEEDEDLGYQKDTVPSVGAFPGAQAELRTSENAYY